MAVGIAALALSGGIAAYANLYQRYESWVFDQQLNVRDYMTPGGVAVVTDVHPGDLVGKLEISRLGISVVVLEGVESATLRVAAGHVPGTAALGTPGNVAIAAHRDTFFRELRKIVPNDVVQVSTVRSTATYAVDFTEIVQPNATYVLDSSDSSKLTLITCYPFYNVGPSSERFIVHAHLVS